MKRMVIGSVLLFALGLVVVAISGYVGIKAVPGILKLFA